MLTIISYNIMFNDNIIIKRYKALIKLLFENSPDVICLQEVPASFVYQFISALKSDYLPVADCLYPSGRAYGEMIFVKKNIQVIDCECIPLPSNMSRAILHATLEKNSEIFHILTFHLESLNSKKIRQYQLDILWQVCEDLSRAILCGDTNMREDEDSRIPVNVLDAWEQTDGTLGEFTYFGDRYWNNTHKHRYDRVLFTDDLKLNGFGVLGNKSLAYLNGRWISDHDGLFAQFQGI